ncbi:dihydroflavonol-4-reductase [Pedobacter africanus]|uniref:Dihydroflavonol-4-reductase n=1 Tax=Pedobacter africanus TaxID=151894 RepID=A0ACC6KRR2_9SPHI|nr:NAD-dependent epimerase/dehydratase family protein [Pedobacter africanus]MDR6781822.1 dihydroflavonol-4-reductase [Pedobacter africanus]
MSKVLVTGGNGFLGANAARELYRRGYEVKLMMRASADTMAVADIPCELYYGDISREEDVFNAVKGCDYVVHTASVTGQWGISFKAYEEINVKGTIHIVNACLKYNVKRLIHISTANTIGHGNKIKPATELNSFRLSHLGSGYISSKYIAQQYVLEQVVNKGLQAVIINPTFMIGQGDAKPSSGKIIMHGINKRVVFYPPGGKNFVHINDVCTGIANAIEMGKNGDCYLLAGENLSYAAFFKLLNKVSGQKPVMFRIPQFVLKMIGIMGTLLGLLSKTSVKLNYSAAYMLCIYNYYSGKKSERELMVKYTPVEKAISNALTWFKENNYC